MKKTITFLFPHPHTHSEPLLNNINKEGNNNIKRNARDACTRFGLTWSFDKQQSVQNQAGCSGACPPAQLSHRWWRSLQFLGHISDESYPVSVDQQIRIHQFPIAFHTNTAQWGWIDLGKYLLIKRPHPLLGSDESIDEHGRELKFHWLLHCPKQLPRCLGKL